MAHSQKLFMRPEPCPMIGTPIALAFLSAQNNSPILLLSPIPSVASTVAGRETIWCIPPMVFCASPRERFLKMCTSSLNSRTWSGKPAVLHSPATTFRLHEQPIICGFDRVCGKCVPDQEFAQLIQYDTIYSD